MEWRLPAFEREGVRILFTLVNSVCHLREMHASHSPTPHALCPSPRLPLPSSPSPPRLVSLSPRAAEARPFRRSPRSSLLAERQSRLTLASVASETTAQVQSTCAVMYSGQQQSTWALLLATSPLDSRPARLHQTQPQSVAWQPLKSLPGILSFGFVLIQQKRSSGVELNMNLLIKMTKTRRMHSRTSFKAFLEVVRRRSLPWEDVEMDAIHSLQVILRGSLQGETNEDDSKTIVNSTLDDAVGLFFITRWK